MDSQGDGTRGSAIATKGVGVVRISVESNALVPVSYTHLFYLRDASAGITSMPVKREPLMRPVRSAASTLSCAKARSR